MASESGERSLDRRSFIEKTAAGSAAGAVLVGASGCGGVLRRSSSGENTIDRQALSSQLEHLDAGLESIRGTRPISGAVEKSLALGERRSNQEVASFLDRGDELARKSLRSLLLAGAIMDLPDEARELPEVRSRVEALSDEMDEAVFDTTALLATCPVSEQRAIQDALREDPELVMRVAEVVDERGSTRGLGRTGRRRLREIGTHISGRLRRQPPAMLFDECVETVERVVERHGLSVTMERWLASEAVAQAFWGVGPDGDRDEHKEDKSPEIAEQDSEAPNEDRVSDSAAASESTVQQHIQALGDPDVARRVSAARALGELRAAGAVPALSRALRGDASSELRGWALRALHQIGTPEARQAMTVAREDSDERIRQLETELSSSSSAAPSVSRNRAVQTPGAAEFLAMLSEPNVSRRVQAARRLGELQAEEAVVPLARRLREDASPEVRGWCLRALSQIGTEDAVSAMMLARNDSDARVRELATELTSRQAAPTRHVAPVDLSEVEPREGASSRNSGRVRRAMISGGAVAGAGAVILAIGGIVLGVGAIGGAYAMTAGGVILVAGIIVLIVGGVMRARARRQTAARG